MKRLLPLLTAIFVLALAACGGNNAPAASTITFESALDGAVQTATWYPAGNDAPPILLLHMMGSNRAVWQEFAGQLNAAGYAAMTLDMRGHGDSAGERDWQKVAADVHQAYELMLDQSDVDTSKAAIIGASIGANMAILEAADNPSVQTIALLSPGVDYRGVQTEDAMAAIGDSIPVLIINSSDDSQAVFDGFQLSKLTTHEDSKVSQLMDSGHGTNMLTANPTMGDLLIEWLNGRLK